MLPSAASSEKKMVYTKPSDCGNGYCNKLEGINKFAQWAYN